MNSFIAHVTDDTNIYTFCGSDQKNRYNFDSFMAIVVLAIVIFLFDNLREKGSVSLTK